MKRKIFILLSVLIFSLCLIPTVTKADGRNLNIERISSNNRYNTSIEVSRRTFSSSEYVIVASGEDFPDALVGGTLASQIDAPILLASKNSISQDVLDEIIRLSTKKVFLLGGTGTISGGVGDKIKSIGVKVERVYGSNRVDTAKKIEKIRYDFASYIIPGDYYAVVSGTGFADALAAAPFVGQMDPVTYLYPYMGNTSSGKTYYMAFGGTNSVPKGYAERIRYSGSNRYSTAVKIAQAYDTQLKKTIDTIVIVDGNNYPDALSSSPVASMNNGAILLTDPKVLPKETENFIRQNNNIENIIIVGGENSVSKAVENQLRNL